MTYPDQDTDWPCSIWRQDVTEPQDRPEVSPPEPPLLTAGASDIPTTPLLQDAQCPDCLWLLTAEGICVRCTKLGKPVATKAPHTHPNGGPRAAVGATEARSRQGGAPVFRKVQPASDDAIAQIGQDPPAPENPEVIPASHDEKPAVGVLPFRRAIQPHGGWLKQGGTRGPGRPRSVVRQEALDSWSDRVPFLEAVIDGESFEQMGQFGPIDAPARVGDRIKAMSELRQMAGQDDPVDEEDPSAPRKLTVILRRE